MGQNFSWLKQVGHELEQQRARNLRNEVLRICVKIECKRLSNPIKGQSNCQLIHKNYTYWWKNLDWCCIRKTFALRLSSVEEIDPSSSSWKPTSRQWRSDWILENKRSSPESFLVLSSLVWRKVKEQHGRVRTKENISVLFWFFRNSSIPPSSSRSFRTQLHWSYSTGQCPYSERFSSTTFITSDVQSIYIPSSIQDWHRKDKIWATDRQYSFCLWIPWTKNTRILTRSTWKHRVLHNTCMKHGRNIKAWNKHQNTVWVDINLALKKELNFRSNAFILHETLPAYCIPKVVRMETWKSHIREGLCVTSSSSKDFLETWLDERFGFRSCSTTRRRSCSTSKKFQMNPTKSEPKSR